MINLLPPATKQTYLYARHNHALRHWVSAFSFALLGALLLVGAGAFYLHYTTQNYTEQVAQTEEKLKKQDVAGVQKQVTEISNNLQLVVQVLSKQVLFSQVLKQLGTVTPSNVILTNLAISQTQGAIDITAQTANYNAATQLQVNLSDPNNKIFAKADIVSINCPTNSTGGEYPCTATLRALFAKDNPFLFITNTKKATP
jgi:Tfp pilus assembly protein PilN